MDTDHQGSGARDQTGYRFQVTGFRFVGRTGVRVGFQNITTKTRRTPSGGRFQGTGYRLQVSEVGDFNHEGHEGHEGLGRVRDGLNSLFSTATRRTDARSPDLSS
jgi:hypothetical protein